MEKFERRERNAIHNVWDARINFASIYRAIENVVQLKVDWLDVCLARYNPQAQRFALER